MKQTIAIGLALLALGAVIGQYIVMMENRVTGPLEATIRFFSFFTILTNSLVAIFFARLAWRIGSEKNTIAIQTSGLTAVTLYITVVGLVYQVMLRHLWNPTGAQMVIDELLHTVIPLLTLLFWVRYGHEEKLQFRQITVWMIYPLIYLVYVLVRGHYSGFYPYPFISVTDLGLNQVMIHALLLFLCFAGLAALMIWIQTNILKKFQPIPKN